MRIRQLLNSSQLMGAAEETGRHAVRQAEAQWEMASGETAARSDWRTKSDFFETSGSHSDRSLQSPGNMYTHSNTSTSWEQSGCKTVKQLVS